MQTWALPSFLFFVSFLLSALLSLWQLLLPLWLLGQLLERLLEELLSLLPRFAVAGSDSTVVVVASGTGTVGNGTSVGIENIPPEALHIIRALPVLPVPLLFPTPLPLLLLLSVILLLVLLLVLLL